MTAFGILFFAAIVMLVLLLPGFITSARTGGGGHWMLFAFAVLFLGLGAMKAYEAVTDSYVWPHLGRILGRFITGGMVAAIVEGNRVITRPGAPRELVTNAVLLALTGHICLTLYRKFRDIGNEF